LLTGCGEKKEVIVTVDPGAKGYIDMTTYTQNDLYDAIRNTDIDEFREILSHDVDPNYYYSEKTWDQRPGIMELAVMHRQNFFLQAALENRGDPNALIKNGVETLAFATIGLNDLSKLEILLAHGANINAIGENGYTLFHKAVQVRRFEIASYLYNLGADTHTPDQWGYTPMDTMRKYQARELLDDSDEVYVSLRQKLIRDEIIQSK
jgi:ankyrin repeat protein